MRKTFATHLFAEMQSGKTDTYLLVACELFRLGLIEHVIIMCGSSDTILKKELQIVRRRSYSNFLLAPNIPTEYLLRLSMPCQVHQGHL
jgi:hypothetical protein